MNENKTLPTRQFCQSHQTKPHYLMWFRRDLRLHDNTALTALCEQVLACPQEIKVSAVFFITPTQWQQHDVSLVQVDLLCRTLSVLATMLKSQLNIELMVQICPTFDDCMDAILELCQSQQITHIYANYEYEVNELARDDTLANQLQVYNIDFVRHHDQCILPPQTVTTNDDTMYQVFTPFYKKWQSILDTSPPVLHQPTTLQQPSVLHQPPIDASTTQIDNQAPRKQTLVQIETLTQQTLNHYIAYHIHLQSQVQAIDKFDKTDNIKCETDKVQDLLAHSREQYPAGEIEACHRLDQFIAEDISNYDISRDQPALASTSRLSAYLTIGAISPRLCYLQANKALTTSSFDQNKSEQDIQRWISELAWRDFYRHVMVARPAMVRHKAYKQATDSKVNWSYDNEDFAKWCQGMTGVPLVDAAMRCLNSTGFMHNRLRMVTAMFLTKDLLIDWRWGERYFMSRLIDGDFASNNGGWQWSASVGTDAAPYFRIMNPFSQAKTHDKDAIFIKQWLPELQTLPATILQSEDKLRKALTTSAELSHIDYPAPMVEHKQARLYAIEQFKNNPD